VWHKPAAAAAGLMPGYSAGEKLIDAEKTSGDKPLSLLK
jgi:hypothetical protein